MNPLDLVIQNQQIIIELLNKILNNQQHFSNLADIIEDESPKEDSK